MRILLLVLMTVAVYAIDVQKLLDDQAYFMLSQEMEMLTTCETMEGFPTEGIKPGHQVLLTNDYHLRQLWEFDGESWNAWENDILNTLLNKPEMLLAEPKQKTTGYQLRIITFQEKNMGALQQSINDHLSFHQVNPSEIISLQFFPAINEIKAIISY